MQIEHSAGATLIATYKLRSRCMDKPLEQTRNQGAQRGEVHDVIIINRTENLAQKDENVERFREKRGILIDSFALDDRPPITHALHREPMG